MKRMTFALFHFMKIIIVRSYLIIPSSHLQTKKWRQNQEWYRNGKHNECEIYQRNLVEKITSSPCQKTNMRINIVTKELSEKKYPMKDIDGFDWTEDMDGIIETSLFPTDNKETSHIYFNLKFICESGGVQTRSLREIYHFIENQLDHLIKYKKKNVYFVNILDGDICYKNIDKFKYLINKENYNHVSNKVFVGDSSNFQDWWKGTCRNIC
jgi:hypothetical protein